jgi:ubiquitin C-terminal hydrolase
MTNKFLAEINSSNPLSSNGVVACCYSKLIRELWTGKDTYVSPWELKKAISNFAPQFAGYGQHDSQELISTLLDALHEDTNLVKVKQQGEIEDDDRRTDEEGSRLAQ